MSEQTYVMVTLLIIGPGGAQDTVALLRVPEVGEQVFVDASFPDNERSPLRNRRFEVIQKVGKMSNSFSVKAI